MAEKKQGAGTAAATAKNAVVWFEIPAIELERAAAFYEAVLGIRLKREAMGNENLAIFPCQEGTVSGCVKDNPASAGGDGTLIYLNADGFLKEAVARVEASGGKLRGPIVELPMDMGSYIHIEDTEGNKVGFYSKK